MVIKRFFKYPVISVENFYHVLYDNLLRPINFRVRYYYPCGTCQNLINIGVDSTHEYLFGIAAPLVLFHYDQEPIYAEDASAIDLGLLLVRAKGKYPQLLANSEHSDLKKKICRDNGFLDWYFFYHGFAALDWYRDAKYFANQQQIKHVFLSFNHLVTDKRSYRMSLLARILEKRLESCGMISFHGTPISCRHEIDSKSSAVSSHSRSLISRYLVDRTDLPMIADNASIDGAASARFGHEELTVRHQALFHLINETVFYDNKLHLTEKIFQPIVVGRPFMLAAAPGNLEYLRSYGFKTFGDFIDESYDQEQDPDRRMDLIVDQLQMLCDQSISRLQDMLTEMQPILDHNKNHFFGQFREMITRELLENFDRCLRIWNNGRVDGREIDSHLDLQGVRRLLIS